MTRTACDHCDDDDEFVLSDYCLRRAAFREIVEPVEEPGK